MATPRNELFVWVTWLAKLMAGETRCEWSPWYQTHYEGYEKVPDQSDIAAWTVTHTRMVREVRIGIAKGSATKCQVEFPVKKRLGNLTVSGKIDILECGQTPVIYDCKSGRERNSDKIQVMIYMAILPMIDPSFQHPRGVVYYRHPELPITLENMRAAEINPLTPNDPFYGDLDYYLGLLGAEQAPIKSPGIDCRFCKLAKSECQERVEP